VVGWRGVNTIINHIPSPSEALPFPPAPCLKACSTSPCGDQIPEPQRKTITHFLLSFGVGCWLFWLLPSLRHTPSHYLDGQYTISSHWAQRQFTSVRQWAPWKVVLDILAWSLNLHCLPLLAFHALSFLSFFTVEIVECTPLEISHSSKFMDTFFTHDAPKAQGAPTSKLKSYLPCHSATVHYVIACKPYYFHMNLHWFTWQRSVLLQLSAIASNSFRQCATSPSPSVALPGSLGSLLTSLA